jgi:hypothetical protein
MANPQFSRSSAQTQPLLVRTAKILAAAELLNAWESAKNTADTFGHNPARKAIISAAYTAYTDYLEDNDMYDDQGAIRNALASVQ